MTVQQLTTRSPTYVADGIEDTFPTDFEFLEEEDVKVFVNGSVVADYSVTGGNNAEGNVVFDTPPADGALVDIVRSTSPIQFLYGAALATPTTMERTVDRITRIVQELARKLLGTIHAPDYENEDLVLPDADTRASRYLAFDEDGNPALFTEAPTSELIGEPITLVATQANYTLPVALQSGANENNYAAHLVEGGRLTRGAAYDFTVENDILTLTETPTTANGLAGQELFVELIRPGIDTALLRPGSVTSGSIAVEAINGSHFGFPGQADGDILVRNGGTWLPVPAPSSDGRWRLNLKVGAAGTTFLYEWVKGGLLNYWQFTFNNTVAAIVNTLPDDDNPMLITDGDEIMSRTFTLTQHVASVRLRAVVYAKMGDNATLRIGFFRVGDTESLREARYRNYTFGQANRARAIPLEHQYLTTSPGSVTYTVRVACTNSAGVLNADAVGDRKGGGKIGSFFIIEELGSAA